MTITIEYEIGAADVPIASAKRLVISDDSREIESVLAKTEICFETVKEVEGQKSVKNARKTRILAKKVGRRKKSGHA